MNAPKAGGKPSNELSASAIHLRAVRLVSVPLDRWLAEFLLANLRLRDSAYCIVSAPSTAKDIQGQGAAECPF